jgi:hypothetical protein
MGTRAREGFSRAPACLALSDENHVLGKQGNVGVRITAEKGLSMASPARSGDCLPFWVYSVNA